MVPNIDSTMGHKIKTRNHPIHGTRCVIEYPTNRNPAESLQENAITVFFTMYIWKKKSKTWERYSTVVLLLSITSNHCAPG